MTRAKWKPPFVAAELLLPWHPDIPTRTKSRASTIIPTFVGRKFLVHNGKDYKPVTVTEQMVNHKLGEFSITRKPFSFKKKDQDARKKGA